MNENNFLNQTLENKIDEIHQSGLISDTIKERLHKYRKETNSDAHIFTTNNKEDIRSFAQDLLDFLYRIEIKEPAV